MSIRNRTMQGKRTKNLKFLIGLDSRHSLSLVQASRDDEIRFRHSGHRPGIHEFNAFALPNDARPNLVTRQTCNLTRFFLATLRFHPCISVFIRCRFFLSPVHLPEIEKPAGLSPGGLISFPQLTRRSASVATIRTC